MAGGAQGDAADAFLKAEDSAGAAVVVVWFPLYP